MALRAQLRIHVLQGAYAAGDLPLDIASTEAEILYHPFGTETPWAVVDAPLRVVIVHSSVHSEISEAVRRLLALSPPPAVLIVGEINCVDSEHWLKLGVQDCIAFSQPHRLRAAVLSALKHEAARQTLDGLEAELALHRAAQALLFERNPLPMWMYDVATLRFVAVNDAAIAHYGWTREEFLGLSILDVRPPEDAAAVIHHVRGQATSFRRNERWRHRRKDGTLIEVEVAAHDMPVGDKRTRLVMINDVTERQRAFVTLENERRLMRTLIDQLPDIMYAKDADGTVTLANRAAASARGCAAPDALLGRVLREPDDEKVLAGETILNHEERSGGPGPDERLLITNRIPLRNEAGAIVGMVAVARDVTELRRLQMDLDRAHRVQSVGRLASGIAHDLNNILTPILMSATLLRGNLDATEDRQLCDMVEGAARRGADLIKRLLLFGRGAMDSTGPVSLDALLREIVGIAKETFPRTITVSLHSDPLVPPLQGDASQLYQVFLNLTVNARDAMPDGGTLDITTLLTEIDETQAAELRLPPGKYVTVEIADTGTGIRPELVEKIFDPFFTTKPEGHGTGLGLATAMEIVKRHQGAIRVKPQAKPGTTFQIVLPAQTAVSRLGTPIKPAPRLAGHRERILIVDDEAAIRGAMQRALVSRNYEVAVATDGAKALALFAEHRDTIALVLTDLDMPVFDGESLIEHVRLLNPKVPILIASALANISPERQERLAGIPILAKPFDLDELFRAVGAALHPAPPRAVPELEPSTGIV